MARRFLRENSQLIAVMLIPSYAGFNVLYRASLSNSMRDDYEFRNKNDVYLGISLKDQEELRKILLRYPTNFNRKLNFIRSNTIDFVSFGYCNIQQGAFVGLPPSYFANATSDLKKLTPFDGFHNFMGKKITQEDMNEKIDELTRQSLEDSLILSEDAKLFAVMRQITCTENFLVAQIDKIFDMFAIAAGYWFSFSRTRMYKLQLAQRRKVYLVSGILVAIAILSSRLFIQKYLDANFDKETCRLGLDSCEGSIQYYDKIIERNKILRQILPDGPKLIDSDGEYLVRPFKLPFTNSFYIYLPNYGMRLQDRKKACEQELARMVLKLTGAVENNSSEGMIRPVSSGLAEASSTAKKDGSESDKEWPLFKKIRLYLEESRK